ncbi:MAG: 50S ribosomal protein L9 [Pseudomonadota bacterium]|nr:50S ribosomal protein L9 [Pseudomonadota bacterium]
MKVLLLKKINKLGNIGSEISVKPGYARNYLLPKKIAVLPTKENLLLVEKKKQELLIEEEKLKNLALEKKEKFENYSMSFSVKVQEGEDKIFGSVTLQNILDQLIKDGHDIEKKQLNLPSGTIRSLGQYKAHINLHPEVDVTVSIDIKEEPNILPKQ